ncbi:sensor domain-containing diguanylate cyclase [Cohnella zeiphila]|uniref:GGDEF domain-containing protein n=1 Tax=Cohnella zeiphila TaxID=2761120 RepID=A0A7X0SJK7_9BACL|nr:GGDEF domain-containing protein [Cohnella zeiphila]MBB6731146.1 GGDEF domain-containing protein [Cohnella zeiphila]
MNDNLTSHKMTFSHSRWNRLLLLFYWCVLLISVLVEVCYIGLTKTVTSTFICMSIVRPTALLAVVIALAEVGIRRSSKHHDYILISTSTLISVILSVIHCGETYVLLSLFLPVMVSIFYFQVTALIYAVFNTIISFVTICLFSAEAKESLTLGSVAGIAAILLVFAALAVGAMLRGRELSKHLLATYEAQQELLLRGKLAEKLSRTDALTGIGNHRAFQEYMDRFVAQCEARTILLQLAVVDLDNFKAINDTYGHRIGDEVLREIAGLLATQMSSNDVLARYGGEEFAILFKNQTLQEALDRLEDIRRMIATTSCEALPHVPITLSAGLATYVPGLGKEAFFRRADEALYDAKRRGKNRTAVASVVHMAR